VPVGLLMAALAGLPVTGAAEVLRISGTGSALGSIRQLAASFERRSPGVTVRLLPSVGSGGAIRAVAEGALDIGISGRALLPEEQARGLVELAYARTPFVFAVGPRVTAENLTGPQLARIYRGELTSWDDGERIRLVLRPRTDVDTLVVRAISPELDAAMEQALGRDGLVMAATNQDCNEVLARTPGSIGPSTLSQLLTEAQALRPLAWHGVVPSVRGLERGAYPLGKTLRLVVRARPAPAAGRFLAWLRTPAAREILERTGNLPLPLPAAP
jgi:phosphate transport system substrate-binding protein